MIKGKYIGYGIFDLMPAYAEKAVFNFADESFTTTAHFVDGVLDFEAMRNDPGLLRDIKDRELEARRFYDAREHS